jgi:hypothetical protein
MFEIFGSHGAFSINDDGSRTEEPLPEDYNDIIRFDVKEYKEWVEKHKLGDSDTLDILVIGYWYKGKDGVEKYNPAEEDYRKQVVEGWSPPIIANKGLFDMVTEEKKE